MGQCTPQVQSRPSASGAPATADLRILSADRVDILNVHKLKPLSCFKITFARRTSQTEVTAPYGLLRYGIG
jgi:hypothetical protein